MSVVFLPRMTGHLCLPFIAFQYLVLDRAEVLHAFMAGPAQKWILATYVTVKGRATLVITVSVSI